MEETKDKEEKAGEVSPEETNNNPVLVLFLKGAGSVSAICFALFFYSAIFNFSLFNSLAAFAFLFLLSICVTVLILAEEGWILATAGFLISFFISFFVPAYSLFWTVGLVLAFMFLSGRLKGVEKDFKASASLNFYKSFVSIYGAFAVASAGLLIFQILLSSGMLNNGNFMSHDVFNKYFIDPAVPLVNAIYPDVSFEAPVKDIFKIDTPVGSIQLLPPGADPDMSLRDYFYRQTSNFYTGLPLIARYVILAIFSILMLQTLMLIANIAGILLSAFAYLLFLILRFIGLISVQHRSIPKEYLRL